MGARRPPGGQTVVLIVGGGIAAYKVLPLIRRLRERGHRVRPIMSSGAGAFVTPLSVGAIAGEKVFEALFDRDDEHDVGHIRLAREADAVIVAPATASMMAAMAHGFASDLATAVLLATRAPVLIAPAMNPAMWDHPATRANLATLEGRGVRVIGPGSGEMAESGEAGTGRMSEPEEIAERTDALLGGGAAVHPEGRDRPLAGRRALVTSGPTHEPIDPVRYIANRSSGKQGHAIAAALARAGAEVTLVSGPVSVPDPPDVRVVRVETAREMLDASLRAAQTGLDCAVMVAAVADWRTEGEAGEKIKKSPDGPPALRMVENPDILATLGHHARRPRLVVGFAAETTDVDAHARAKLARKGADWIVANDVSPEHGVMGGDANTVRLVTGEGVEAWPTLSKAEVAERLVARIAATLAGDGERGA